MSKFDKIKLKIKNGQSISFEEAKSFLLKLGFEMRSPGSSHFIFFKKGYEKNISIKKRPELYPYQVVLLQEVLNHHEQD